MTKLPSIAILHYTLPPVVGGVEAVILAQARGFIRAGYPVTLIAGRGQRDALPQHSELILVPELDTRHSEIVQISEALANGHVPEAFTPAVEKLIDSLYPILKRFDHVIIHNVLTKHFNLPLTAALIRLIEMGGIRHAIAWCHDASWTSPGSREKVQPGYPWDLLRTPLGDVTYVAVSEKRQHELADLFNMEPEMIHLSYNGVEPRTLLGFSTEGMELVERLGLLNSDLTLLMPVRITPAKNIEYALSVLAHLRMACQNPRLVVTGPPDPHNAKNMDYFESLLVMRDRLGIARHAEFVYECGPNAWEPYTISESVVAELYRISDVVFIPSLREGFGMPVLEAGLCGIPVISADTVPASLEIGKQDVSMFSADVDPQDMALKILSLVNKNPISHLRRRLRKGYTWQALFQRAIEPLLIEEKRFA